MIIEKVHLTKKLHYFMEAGNIQTRGDEKLPAGTYPLLGEQLIGNDRWWKLQGPDGPAWIVAESPKGRWWVTSPNSHASESTPKGTADRNTVLSAIPQNASPGQKRAIRWAVSKLGYFTEDQGDNKGRYLTPELIMPYRKFQGISGNKGMPWCAAYAEAARYHGVCDPGGDGDLNLLNKKSWKSHPLGTWNGAAWYIEKLAIDKNLWIPSGELKKLASGTKITAAIVLMARAGSGSDKSNSQRKAMPGQKYAGHADLAVAWDGDEIFCLGGNLSNTIKQVHRRVNQIRGAVLF